MYSKNKPSVFEANLVVDSATKQIANAYYKDFTFSQKNLEKILKNAQVKKYSNKIMRNRSDSAQLAKSYEPDVVKKSALPNIESYKNSNHSFYRSKISVLNNKKANLPHRSNQIVYLDAKNSWNHLRHGLPLVEPELVKFSEFSLHNFYRDNESIKSLPNHNIKYINDTIIENESLCTFCKEAKPSEQIYPCRICTKVFHIKCIEQNGLLRSEQERKILLQAYSNIGWSCSECSNLSNLIPQSDILELIEKFEFSDINHDYGISNEEFLRIREEDNIKQFGVGMSPDDIEATNLRFKLTDCDKSGFIDWDEYLNYECMRRLHRIPARELVLKLTPKEIEKAREAFYSLDKDKGGTVSEEEARRSFRHWFIFLHQNQLNQEDVDMHVKMHTDLLMNATLKRKEELTWDNYIKEQAIYILVGRPNNPVGLLNEMEEKQNKIQLPKVSSVIVKTNFKHNEERRASQNRILKKENDFNRTNKFKNNSCKKNLHIKYNFDPKRSIKSLNSPKWIIKN